jgi:hypothetical protein
LATAPEDERVEPPGAREYREDTQRRDDQPRGASGERQSGVRRGQDGAVDGRHRCCRQARALVEDDPAGADVEDPAHLVATHHEVADAEVARGHRPRHDDGAPVECLLVGLHDGRVESEHDRDDGRHGQSGDQYGDDLGRTTQARRATANGGELHATLRTATCVDGQM